MLQVNGLRVFRAALCLGTLVCALLAPYAPAAHAKQKADGPYYIHATEVNLRETPNGEIVLVFDVNDKVFIIERDGNWSYVSAPGREAKGYVWQEYIGNGRIDPVTGQLLKPVQQQEVGNAIDIQLDSTPSQPAATTPPPAEPSAQAGEGAAIEDVAVSEGSELSVSASPAAASLGKVIARSAGGGGASPATDPATNDNTGAAGADMTVYTFGDGSSASPPASPQAASVQMAALPTTPVTIDTPDIVDIAKCYKPVGGHDIALISGSNVNVRQDASLGSQVIGSVNTGDKVYVVCFDDPWYYVSIPAKELKGWVFGEYVSALPRVEITGDKVRLREVPSTKQRIKADLYSGDVFYEFSRDGSWVLVASSASGLKGWVHGDYVRKTERTASRPFKVTGDGVNFRTSATVDSVIISELAQGTTVNVLGRNDKWSFIQHGGQQGWMYSQYLDPDFKGAPQAIYGKSIGDRLIKRAKAMEGTPYVWGGESDSGVDCSGLIYKLLLDEGADAYGLPRRASTQMAGLGLAVDKENLIPGDLVFFTTYKAGASHVGIYLGDGDFIHASSAQSKVTISNMSEGYYRKRFVGARRITEDELKRLK